MKPEAGKYYTGRTPMGDNFWCAVFNSPMGLQMRRIETSWHTGFSIKGEALEDSYWLDDEGLKIEECTQKEFEQALIDTANAVLALKEPIYPQDSKQNIN